MATRSNALQRVLTLEKENPSATAFEKVDTYLVDDQPLLYGVGVDGSKLSKKCFKVCVNLARKANADRIYVLHVIQDDKANSPLESPEHIKKEVELAASKIGVEITWYTEPRDKSESTCTALMRLVERLELDFVILGAYGSSGEGNVEMNGFLKEPQSGQRRNSFSQETVGSTSDETLRSCDTSVVLCMSSSFELEEPRTIIFVTDHKSHSESAFALFMRRMVRDGDKVTVLFVSVDEKKKHEHRFQIYEQELQKANIDGKCLHIHPEGGQSTSDAIADYSRKIQADFVFMGVAGYVKNKLGSVSMGLIRQLRCNAVMIKDPREVATKRETIALNRLSIA